MGFVLLVLPGHPRREGERGEVSILVSVQYTPHGRHGASFSSNHSAPAAPAAARKSPDGGHPPWYPTRAGEPGIAVTYGVQGACLLDGSLACCRCRLDF